MWVMKLIFSGKKIESKTDYRFLQRYDYLAKKFAPRKNLGNKNNR